MGLLVSKRLPGRYHACFASLAFSLLTLFFLTLFSCLFLFRSLFPFSSLFFSRILLITSLLLPPVLSPPHPGEDLTRICSGSCETSRYPGLNVCVGLKLLPIIYEKPYMQVRPPVSLNAEVGGRCFYEACYFPVTLAATVAFAKHKARISLQTHPPPLLLHVFDDAWATRTNQHPDLTLSPLPPPTSFHPPDAHCTVRVTPPLYPFTPCLPLFFRSILATHCRTPPPPSHPTSFHPSHPATHPLHWSVLFGAHRTAGFATQTSAYYCHRLMVQVSRAPSTTCHLLSLHLFPRPTAFIACVPSPEPSLPPPPPHGKKGTPQAPPEYSDPTQLPSTPPDTHLPYPTLQSPHSTSSPTFMPPTTGTVDLRVNICFLVQQQCPPPIPHPPPHTFPPSHRLKTFGDHPRTPLQAHTTPPPFPRSLRVTRPSPPSLLHIYLIVPFTPKSWCTAAPHQKTQRNCISFSFASHTLAHTHTLCPRLSPPPSPLFLVPSSRCALKCV